MKNIAFATVTLSFTLSLCSLASAHGDGSTLMGTVTAVSENEIVVRATDGDIVKVPVDKGTTYSKGAKTAGASDLAAGMRVVIEVDPTDGAVAKSVRLPETATPDAPAHSAHDNEKGGHEGHEHHGKPQEHGGHPHSTGD